MDNPQLSDAQLEALGEVLERGEAFEEMMNSKGWMIVKAYYQSKIQAYTTMQLTRDEPTTSDMERVRFELIGIRKLLSYIDGSVKTLHDHREKGRSVATVQ